MAYIQKSYQKKFGNKDNSMETSIIEDVTYLVEKANNTPDPTYKVYTALLTQSGGNNPQGISSGALTKGVTYTLISEYPSSPWDFSNVGGPIYPDTTPFVATSNDVPNVWGGTVTLAYNTGAPVVTVLENTLDFDLIFERQSSGIYFIKKNGGDFNLDKTWYSLGGFGNLGVAASGIGYCTISTEGNQITILSYNNITDQILIDGQLIQVPIEIRVYN